mmetsp:Transcript_6390/g.26871  ORF Transcript_6390/g.26871 Transcript_6390/m.26871 type:complete len:530 (+) Transcript_6390:142-1731(+)
MSGCRFIACRGSSSFENLGAGRHPAVRGDDERAAMLRAALLGAPAPTLRFSPGDDVEPASLPRWDAAAPTTAPTSSGALKTTTPPTSESAPPRPPQGGSGGGLSSSASSSRLPRRASSSQDLALRAAAESDAQGGGPKGPSPASAPRRAAISAAPFKMLEAPGLADDFYLDLVAWSARNVLAVGLGSRVLLWSGCATHATELCDLGPGDSVCSVAWTAGGTHLAVGLRTGGVSVWDALAKKRVFRDDDAGPHASRVGCLSWRGNDVLASGSRDRSVCVRDVREASSSSRPSCTRIAAAHRQEVCGLRWSPCGDLLASGGNDNKLLVWDARATLGTRASSSAATTTGRRGGGAGTGLTNPRKHVPACKFAEHVAAVKAIAWSPHRRGLLASGAGTADRTIKFWNAVSGQHIHSIDTGSQVCALAWSPSEEWGLASTHGYSLNHVCVWRLDRHCRVADSTTLVGHTQRVLYLATSPDGKSLVTGAGDETLRFWRVWPGAGAAGGAAGLRMSATHGLGLSARVDPFAGSGLR